MVARLLAELTAIIISEIPHDYLSMRLILILLSSLFSITSFAFPCYLTVVKGDCWKMYDVSVQLRNNTSDNNLVKVTVNKGALWARVPFECEAGERLTSFATFSPKIWDNDEGKVYEAKHFIFLPEEIKADQAAWDVPICFPKAFPSVSMPPEATKDCACDFTAVPPIIIKK